MNRLGVLLVCALGAMTAGIPALAQAQGAAAILAQAATPVARITVAELAGTWVEPVTESDADGIRVFGTENIVDITRDGRFRDSLELTFTFVDVPQYDGTYKVKTSGRVTIAAGQMTWATETAEVVPVFPVGASEAKRAAMREFADSVATGMVAAETYPIVAYDGNELVMNAGSDSLFEEYSMVRR